MAFFSLPQRQELGIYTFQVDFDGVEFGVRVRYSTRDNHYYIDLYDVAATPLREGLRCVSNWPLLRLFQDIIQRPAGDIWIVRPNGDADAVREDLGVSAYLTYEGDA